MYAQETRRTHTLHNIAYSPPVKREANNNNNRIVEALSLHPFHSLLRHPHLPPPFILPCATPRTTTKKGIRHPSSVFIVSKRTKSMKRGRRLCQWTIESEHTHILNFAQKVTKIRFRNRIDFRRLFLIRPLLLRFRRSFACEEVQGRISPTRRAGYRGCSSSSSSSSSRKEKQKKRRKQF